MRNGGKNIDHMRIGFEIDINDVSFIRLKKPRFETNERSQRCGLCKLLDLEIFAFFPSPQWSIHIKLKCSF